MPVYRIDVPDKDGKTIHTRLVEAPNQASARGHVARALFKVAIVTTADAFRLAKDGVELETSVAEPAPAPEPPADNGGQSGQPPEDTTGKDGKAK